MTNIKFLLIGTSLSFIPNLTLAQCVATQDCETLGYTETSCNGGKGVKCPFGNKWACITSEIELEQQFCDKYGFVKDCNQTGYTGLGPDCYGKYSYCTCADGYKEVNGSCQKILNGPQGNLYYCNDVVTGVKVSDLNFYVGLQDVGEDSWPSAKQTVQNYKFCDNISGRLPTVDELFEIYNNKQAIITMLKNNGGKVFSNYNVYCSSSMTCGYNGKFHCQVNLSTGEDHAYVDGNTYLIRAVLSM